MNMQLIRLQEKDSENFLSQFLSPQSIVQAKRAGYNLSLYRKTVDIMIGLSEPIIIVEYQGNIEISDLRNLKWTLRQILTEQTGE